MSPKYLNLRVNSGKRCTAYLIIPVGLVQFSSVSSLFALALPIFIRGSLWGRFVYSPLTAFRFISVSIYYHIYSSFSCFFPLTITHHIHRLFACAMLFTKSTTTLPVIALAIPPYCLPVNKREKIQLVPSEKIPS